MIRLTMSVQGSQKIDIALAGLAGRIQDWTNFWPKIFDAIEQKIEFEQFETRGARGPHGTWADYRDNSKGNAGPATLRDTDRLWESLTSRTGDSIREANERSARFGTMVPYAIYHQYGTRKMAARRIFDFADEDHRVIARAMQSAVLNYARRLGFAVGGRSGRDFSASDAMSLGRSILMGGGGFNIEGAELD